MNYQMHLFDFIERPKTGFPCDDCIYDIKGCCNYPDTKDDFCVMGDKRVPTEN